MKRIALLSIIFALVISLAAPTGAAFALDEGIVEPIALPEVSAKEEAFESEPLPLKTLQANEESALYKSLRSH